MAKDYGNGEITFEILEHIGVLATYITGWKKEINLVSWNGSAAKYDIREWDPSHERMSKGVTLKENEMRTLLEVMRRRHRNDSSQNADENECESELSSFVADGEADICDDNTDSWSS